MNHKKACRGLLKEHGKFLRRANHGDLYEVPARGGTVLTIPPEGKEGDNPRWRYAYEEIHRTLRKFRLSEKEIDDQVATILHAPEPEPAAAEPAVTPTPPTAQVAPVDTRQTDVDDLVDRLKAWRVAHGVTQAGVGVAIKVSQWSVSKWEQTGHVAADSREAVELLLTGPPGTDVPKARGRGTGAVQGPPPVVATVPPPLEAVTDGQTIALPCPHCSGKGTIAVSVADLQEFLLKKRRST